jgi:hypothetical protein
VSCLPRSVRFGPASFAPLALTPTGFRQVPNQLSKQLLIN